MTFAKRIVSLSSKFCDSYSEWMIGIRTPEGRASPCCRTPAWKKIR